MLQPKRVKYRKMHRGHRRGVATSGNSVSFGEYGLKAMECAWITARQIEAARIAINRHMRRGGNVWQHLRSFKKRLFDAIPDDALRLDGDYIDLANDWAYMLPIVEMADMPVHIAEPLYLYEPSGIWKGADRALREEVIARIVAKDTLYQDETCDAYSGNIDARDRR